jgi:hypothetical protein
MKGGIEMTIGLTKAEIIAKLNENKDFLAEDVFDKIADIIVENNKRIEKQVGEIVASQLLKKMR